MTETNRSPAYRLEPAFPPSDAQRERAIALWNEERVFASSQDALERSRQLAFLIERDDGELAGVCTVLDAFAPLAGERVWMYRTFVRPRDRRGLLVVEALAKTYALLQEKTPQGGPSGVFLTTENERLKRRGAGTRLTRLGWHCLGVNPLGQTAWLRRF